MRCCEIDRGVGDNHVQMIAESYTSTGPRSTLRHAHMPVRQKVKCSSEVTSLERSVLIPSSRQFTNCIGAMQSIRQIERLNQTELDKCIPPNASWHTDYRDTAYIYIGGLPFELSEGDILTIFSQYGNPVHINLVRDKETGKSKGFCFLKYEDQKSCDLAVDNLSGAGVMGRVISVDHTRYKKKEGEVEGIMDEEADEDDTDQEGDSRRKRRRTDESESEEERPLIKEEIELAKLIRAHDDDDPMKEYLVKEKKDEVAEALKTMAKTKSKDKERKHRHRHHHRSRRDDEDGDGDRRKDRHRSRRDREDDEEEEDRSHRHRSHRSRRETGEDGDDRRKSSRRDRSRTPASDGGGRRHRSRRDRSLSEEDRPRKRRDRSDSVDGRDSTRGQDRRRS